MRSLLFWLAVFGEIVFGRNVRLPNRSIDALTAARKGNKFTNLKNSSFSRFVQAIFTFVHFAFVCVISTTTNHLLCNFQFFFLLLLLLFFLFFFCNCIYFKPNDWKSREIIAVIILLGNFLAFADITRGKIRRLSDRISRLSLAFFSWIRPITKNGAKLIFEINFTAKSWW